MSQTTDFQVNPKLPFNRLGPSGLRVPVFALGGWLTLGGTVKGDLVKEIMQTAFENGINMIDTAESYSKGQSEIEIGRVIKELKWRRSDLIITTKLFFGVRTGPNDRGLSRKHIIEGLNESLQRLGLDYVDVVFAHRPDPTVPMEEVVRAFNHVIDQGKAFYWATSEWSAREIEQAFHVANRLGLIGPIAEQCQHNLFHRDRPEGEYLPIYQQYGIGTTVWSALAAGLLTGKYNNGIPANSRFDQHKDFFKDTLQSLTQEEGMAKIEKVKKLDELAKKELNATVTHLALAFISLQPQTSTVILGCSSKEQLLDQLKALDVIEQLKKRPDILEKVEEILGNKPKKAHTYGR